MRRAKQILLVTSVLALSVSGANAGLWRRKPPQPADASIAASTMSLAAVELDGSRVVLHTSGAPAYTSYSPSPNVFVIDLTGTSRPAELALPANLPASIASIAAEEVVEMGNRLTRVTFRLNDPLALEVSAEEKAVVVSLPASAIAAAPAPDIAPIVPVPQPEAVAEVVPEVVNAAPHSEPVAETLEPVSEPVTVTESRPLAKAKSVRDISANDGEVSIAGDGELTYKAFRLNSPERVVIDLTGVNNAVTRKTIDVNDSVVKRIRVAQFKGAPDPVTRVVIDLGAKSEYTVTPEGDHVRISFGAASTVASAPREYAKPIPIIEEPAPAPVTAPAPAPAPLETVRVAVPTDLPSQVPVIAENAPTWKVPEPASKGAKKVINAQADQNPPAPAPRRLSSSEDVFSDQPDQRPTQTLSGTLRPSRQFTQGARQFTGEPISLNLKDADIKDVLRTFAQITGLNMAIDPGVGGQVTVDFVDVPWDQALDIILRQNSLTFVIEGNVMRVGTIQRLSDEAAAQAALAEREKLNVQVATLSFPLSYARAQEVATLIGAVASPRARIIVDNRTNQLIISEIPQYLQTMQNLIETIDVPTRQVVIEARIVETSKVFNQQFGFDWNFGGVLDPALGTGTGLVFPNRIGFTGGPFSFTGGAPQVLGFTFTDVLGTFSLDFALHAFEQEGLVKVISAPRVTTQDNTPAEIQSGFQIPYQTRINFTTTVQYLDATLRLSVTPQITHAGTVIMDIAVQKNEPATGLAIEGAAGTPLTTRRATTKLMVRDGGTAVIAGIYQTKDNHAQTRVPFVHQIPVIGNLFKSHNISTSHDELLIFITPRIVRG
ncbi:MAG TPA: type IV pilus secretin PilQ [Thermoanaerobaculia bacterium]|nr:type IV pilus secretin PilQ [Thermoanaerobaculia bacterium]